ncbi:MAG: TIM barrel protein [Cyclobacteriaceae bacterium]|nr:TIM barrel protein [Cyclobacteriaceae bacterium]
MNRSLIPKLIEEQNKKFAKEHQFHFNYLGEAISRKGFEIAALLKKIKNFQVAIPSWALGTGGTRFGRFPMGGEPRNLEEKIEDIGLIHLLNKSSNSISLHVPWDKPADITAIRQSLKANDLVIDSVNSNTFQNQSDQKHSYKFGSLCHVEKHVRAQAIAHNLECIEHGEKLNAKTLTVWLADGSNFPGQHHFRKAYEHTHESLAKICKGLPTDWNMLIEYKPYEPNFYSMVIPDWGTSYSLCQSLGTQANVLVDLGHHLPNANIEQIVARLMHFGRLGGFHFNGSMYGDDDLTTGSIKPYQFFLIFNELVDGMEDRKVKNPSLAWMIDASHNTKDPLEDLMQSVEMILNTYAKALLVDRKKLSEAQEENDVVRAEEILKESFQTDTRPLVAEAMKQKGGALKPIDVFRAARVRDTLIQQRGKSSLATGL